MVSIDKLFIVSDKWWLCSNDGSISIESDLVKDESGKNKHIKQTTVFLAYNSFVNGQTPTHGEKVECMYELNGINLCFKGAVNSFNGSTCILNIESEHTDKGIKEICNKINTNNYI